MNISRFGKSLVLGFAGSVMAIAGIASAQTVSSTGSSSSCASEYSADCNQGTGGSNPLVLEALRQETYRNREAQALQDAMNAEATAGTEQETTIIVIVPTATPYPTMVPYPEDFQTIGERAAIEAAEAKIEISFETSSNEITRIETQAQENNCSSQFSDIAGNVNASSIEILDCLNIVSGRSDTKFEADEAITRNEAVKIAILVSGSDIKGNTENSINDIDPGDWSVPYTETALEEEAIFLDYENNFEGGSSVYYEEAFALYLNTSNVGIYETNETDSPFSLYNEYREEQTPQICINDFEMPTENKTITRGEFAELSLHILSALLQDPTFEGPRQELESPQFSASRQQAIDPASIFPEIFRRDEE